MIFSQGLKTYQPQKTLSLSKDENTFNMDIHWRRKHLMCLRLVYVSLCVLILIQQIRFFFSKQHNLPYRLEDLLLDYSRRSYSI